MSDDKYILFHGQQVILIPQSDGSYKDPSGTTYPSMLFDPGYCGIYPFETGDGDPFHKIACARHDTSFQKMLLGYQDSTQDNLKVFGTFVKDIGTGMYDGLKGDYGVVGGAYVTLMGLPYILIGGIGGMARWASLSIVRK